jgi:excinuclease ABC subunit C
MQNAKRKEMKRSSLEDIKGIGPRKAQILLKEMGTLTAIKKATVAQLNAVKGISQADAEAIYNHFSESGNS